MRLRTTTSLVALGAIAALAPVSAAHAQAGPRGQYVVPRLPDGKPDLQGNWSNATITPLVRPQGQGPTMPLEEALAIQRRSQVQREAAVTRVLDPDREAPPVGGDGSTGAAGGVGGYNSVYIDRGDGVVIFDGQARTSFIVDPPDGRVPPINDAVRQQRLAAAGGGRGGRGGGAGLAALAGLGAGGGQYDNPETRPAAERCIVSFGSNAGPPMLPNGFYNNNYTIVQTPDHVMILTEMVHDARIIKIGDGPRLPPHVRPYFGDSWGKWVGDTLVIETTNIHPSQRFQGQSSDYLTVIERLWRADAETLNYRFTIVDDIYTQPWSGELTFNSIGSDKVYEYACHEGNYALYNVLSGARAQERAAAQNQNQPR
jgi:hypothetical protein